MAPLLNKDYFVVSTGGGKDDFLKLQKILEAVDVKFICIGGNDECPWKN